MDNGKGLFKAISEAKFDEQMQMKEPMVFKTGEILIIRGSRFRVEKIENKKLILKLLPKLQDNG